MINMVHAARLKYKQLPIESVGIPNDPRIALKMFSKKLRQGDKKSRKTGITQVI